MVYKIAISNWFQGFCAGDFSVKDEQRAGRPVNNNDDKINGICYKNPNNTTCRTAQKFDVSHTCIEKHLKQVAYVIKLDLYVPRELNLFRGKVHLLLRC